LKRRHIAFHGFQGDSQFLRDSLLSNLAVPSDQLDDLPFKVGGKEIGMTGVFGVTGFVFGVKRAFFGVAGSVFGVKRAFFGVTGSVFGVKRAFFGVTGSVFGVKRAFLGSKEP